jgi:hypothetical protein
VPQVTVFHLGLLTFPFRSSRRLAFTPIPIGEAGVDFVATGFFILSEVEGSPFCDARFLRVFASR